MMIEVDDKIRIRYEPANEGTCRRRTNTYFFFLLTFELSVTTYIKNVGGWNQWTGTPQRLQVTMMKLGFALLHYGQNIKAGVQG